DVGDRCEVNPRGLQPFRELTRPREAGELPAESCINANGLVAATEYKNIEGPVEHVRSDKHVLEPLCADRRIHICGHRFGRQRQYAVADNEHIDVANAQGVTRW